jgi:hypothetical protein
VIDEKIKKSIDMHIEEFNYYILTDRLHFENVHTKNMFNSVWWLKIQINA